MSDLKTVEEIDHLNQLHTFRQSNLLHETAKDWLDGEIRQYEADLRENEQRHNQCEVDDISLAAGLQKDELRSFILARRESPVKIDILEFLSAIQKPIKRPS